MGLFFISKSLSSLFLPVLQGEDGDIRHQVGGDHRIMNHILPCLNAVVFFQIFQGGRVLLRWHSTGLPPGGWPARSPGPLLGVAGL